MKNAMSKTGIHTTGSDYIAFMKRAAYRPESVRLLETINFKDLSGKAVTYAKGSDVSVYYDDGRFGEMSDLTGEAWSKFFLCAEDMSVTIELWQFAPLKSGVALSAAGARPQRANAIVALAKDTAYVDVDGEERVMPAGTVGRIEEWDGNTGEIVVAIGDNSFDLGVADVEAV